MAVSAYVRELRARAGSGLVMFPTVCAVVTDERGEVLLVRRADTGRWALPAGMMDPGEQPAGTIVREVLEETGVHIAVVRLAGVALRETIYPNGDHCHMVTTWFRCRAVGGTARVADDESTAVAWAGVDALPEVDEHTLLRIQVALDDDAPAWFAQPGGGIL